MKTDESATAEAAPNTAPAPETVEPEAEPESEAKAPETSQNAATGGAMYTIKPGETLWSIAVDQLGDGERFRDILAVNPALKSNPDLLRAGQEIRLPE